MPTPTWVTPKTWVPNEALTAADLNLHLRDNLEALKAPPTDSYVANETSNFTTTNTAFTDVDGGTGKFSLTINTTGGEVLIGFNGHANVKNAQLLFDVLIDGTRLGGDDGLCGFGSASSLTNIVSFVRLYTPLTTGSHTFILQWRVSLAVTATLYAGAGTTASDTHPQFWVREVS
jgi:hypothetical protein